MRSVLPYKTAHALAHRALLGGGALRSFANVEWNIAGTCQKPVLIEITGRHWRDRPRPEGASDAVFPTLEVRCRKCPACLRRRSNLWKYRALRECAATVAHGYRTWFVTLTFSAHNRYRVVCETIQRLKERSVEFGSLEPDEQFRELTKSAGGHATKFFKRLRKKQGDLRYCLVAEAHKDGFPHFHVLIHERCQLTEREIRSEWRTWHGFADASLVRSVGKAAAYVAKYLTKSCLARVRASQDYGRTDDTPEGIAAPGSVYEISPLKTRGEQSEARVPSTVLRTDPNGSIPRFISKWLARVSGRLSGPSDTEQRQPPPGAGAPLPSAKPTCLSTECCTERAAAGEAPEPFPRRGRPPE